MLRLTGSGHTLMKGLVDKIFVCTLFLTSVKIGKETAYYLPLKNRKNKAFSSETAA